MLNQGPQKSAFFWRKENTRKSEEREVNTHASDYIAYETYRRTAALHDIIKRIGQ